MPNGGTRVLVMRLWPRGIRKSRVDHWLKELGPILPLLRAFRAGTITWPQYRRRYLAGLARPAARAQIQEVRRLTRAGRVTLLCGCPDARRCHRTLLHGYLTKHQPVPPAARTTSHRLASPPAAPRTTSHRLASPPAAPRTTTARRGRR